MEPLVAGALAIVIYCGFLTVRDNLDDLHREGAIKSVWAWCRQTVRRFTRRDRFYIPGRFFDENFGFLPRRSLVPVRIRRDAERFPRGRF